jgi:hypothetical protein
MNRHPNNPAFGHWLLVALLPFVAAAIEYLWLEATSPGSGCQSGPGSPSLISLALLVLAVPTAIAVYVRCATGSLGRAWAPMVVSTVLTSPIAMLVFLFWASGHNCFE